MSLGAYDEDRYVKFLMELHQQYPGAGTQMPGMLTRVRRDFEEREFQPLLWLVYSNVQLATQFNGTAQRTTGQTQRHLRRWAILLSRVSLLVNSTILGHHINGLKI